VNASEISSKISCQSTIVKSELQAKYL